MKIGKGCIVLGTKIKTVPDKHVVVDLTTLKTLRKRCVITGPTADGVIVLIFRLPPKTNPNDKRFILQFLQDQVGDLRV